MPGNCLRDASCSLCRSFTEELEVPLQSPMERRGRLRILCFVAGCAFIEARESKRIPEESQHEATMALWASLDLGDRFKENLTASKKEAALSGHAKCSWSRGLEEAIDQSWSRVIEGLLHEDPSGDSLAPLLQRQFQKRSTLNRAAVTKVGMFDSGLGGMTLEAGLFHGSLLRRG